MSTLPDNNTHIELADLYQQAQVLLKQKKYRQADEMLSTLIQKAPENAHYYQLLAKIKESRGLFHEQIVYLTQALAMTPNADDIALQLAYAHLFVGHFQTAYHYAITSTKNINNHPTSYNIRSELFSRLGIHDKAVAMLEKAISLDNKDATLLCRLGEALMYCGKIKAAIKACREAIHLNPELGLAYAVISKARKASIADNHIEQLSHLTVRFIRITLSTIIDLLSTHMKALKEQRIQVLC